MGDLENFLHNDQIHVPTLIRIGIAHYQFETIHPFLDGNGRIGRLLIPLYFVHEKILTRPLLYLSAYFEKNKGLYYDNLTRVREKNDMMHWLKYFLIGTEETARQGNETLYKVIQLKDRVEKTIRQTMGKRAKSAYLLLNKLLVYPFIQISQVESTCNLSSASAGALVQRFVEEGVLKEYTGMKRNHVFAFSKYFNLFN
jgi:Fic family protein